MYEKTKKLFIWIGIIVVGSAVVFVIWRGIGGDGFGALSLGAGSGIIGFLANKTGKGTGGGNSHKPSDTTDAGIDSRFSTIFGHIDALRGELANVRGRTDELESKFGGFSKRIEEGFESGEVTFTDSNGNPVSRDSGIDDSDNS